MKRRQARQVKDRKELSVLSAFELFRGAPIHRLRTLEKKNPAREFASGHLFFHPGETKQLLFLLEKGRVQTFRTIGERKLIIGELEPPAVFGEMGCVGRCEYHCSAQAMEPSRIRSIPRGELDELREEFPEMARRLLDLVSERFVRVLLDLEGMSFRQLLPRMANLLLEKAEGDLVKDTTHKELAEHLRVYRESATTALGELRKAGIIVLERKQIRIVDRSRLERAARE